MPKGREMAEFSFRAIRQRVFLAENHHCDWKGPTGSRCTHHADNVGATEARENLCRSSRSHLARELKRCLTSVVSHVIRWYQAEFSGFHGPQSRVVDGIPRRILTDVGFSAAPAGLPVSAHLARQSDLLPCERQGHIKCWCQIWYIEASWKQRARSPSRCRRNFSKRHNEPAVAASPKPFVPVCS